jgi:hypothetical protein
MVTPPGKLNIRLCCEGAWSDATRFLRGHPLLALASVVLSVWLTYFAVPRPMRQEMDDAPIFSALWALDGLLTLAGIVVLIPCALIIHRRILLGETGGLAAAFAAPGRALRYVTLEALLVILLMIPLGLLNLYPSALDVETSWFGLPAALAALALLVYVLTRTVPMFPAVAIDADRASIREAWRMSGGNCWRIIAAGVIVSMPFIVAGLGLFFLMKNIVVPLIGAFTADMAPPASLSSVEAIREDIGSWRWWLPLALTEFLPRCVGNIAALYWIALMSHVYRLLRRDTVAD